MKKLLLFLTMVFAFFGLFSASAYELNKNSKIYVGGQAIGIRLNNGVSVVGSFGIYENGNLYKPWEEAGISEGDQITSLNHQKITDIKSLLTALQSTKGQRVEITFLHQNEAITTDITPILTDNSYSLGLYVKDCILGVGTLTYYIDEIHTYGSLGHSITSDPYYSGEIYEAKVTEIVKPSRGEAGEKKATIDSNAIGTVEKNTQTGIHGVTNNRFDTSSMTLLNFKTRDEVHLGSAEIWTCINGSKVEKFDINITKLATQDKQDIKGITFEVTDEELISKTGGIVQGMSGSPIVQDNQIIGAVTHVLLNNSKKGYGIYLEFMLEDMGISISE